CPTLLCLFQMYFFCFFFQAEDGIRDRNVTGVQTCALPISLLPRKIQRTPSLVVPLLLKSRLDLRQEKRQWIPPYRWWEPRMCGVAQRRKDSTALVLPNMPTGKQE